MFRSGHCNSHTGILILVDSHASLNHDDLISYLDQSAEKVILSLAHASEVIAIIPSDRILLLDVTNSSAVSNTGRPSQAATPLISSVSHFFSDSSNIDIRFVNLALLYSSLASLIELRLVGAAPVLPPSQLTLGLSSPSQLNIADAFLAPHRSD